MSHHHSDSLTIGYHSPHEYDHTHSDVSSGWLRAAVLGAMDGLVSNGGLIAGVAAAGTGNTLVLLTGCAGLIAGAISMALGEYTSVQSANEQLEREIATESAALRRNPAGEERELLLQFVDLGMSTKTAKAAAREVHQNHAAALSLHLSTELGLSLHDRPSAWVAAFSSLAAFASGALVPLLPYLCGIGSVLTVLLFTACGLVLTGALAAHYAQKNRIKGAIRQLFLGGAAMAVTYAIGSLLGVSVGA